MQPEIPFPTNQRLKDGAGRNLGFYNLEISSLPGTLPQLVPFQGALVQLHDIQSVEYSEVLWGPQKNPFFGREKSDDFRFTPNKWPFNVMI